MTIDAAKQAEVPVQTDKGLRWEVITKGTPEGFNGAYALFADEPFVAQLTGGSPARMSPFTDSGTGVSATITLDAKPDQTAQIHLLFPGRTELPKGIRLIRPNYTVEQADTQVWTNEYIDLLKRMNTGVLRFMDAMRTNGSECTDSWCPHTETLWGVKGRGAPLEGLVGLANMIDADVWANVPHKATDKYVRDMAICLYMSLGPKAHVYVEYSNEVWNTAPGFPQTAWIAEQGKAAGLTLRQQYAKRSKEIAAIFYDVFDGQEHRVVPVMSGQTGNSAVLRESVESWPECPAVAVAGYVNTNTPEAAKAFWEGTQIRKFCDTAGSRRKLLYEWTNVGADVDDPANAATLQACGEGMKACGIEAACHFVPVAPDSKYAATPEVGRWTGKCAALAALSESQPHPYAMDPKDAEIERLKLEVEQLNLDLVAEKAERDQYKAEAEGLHERIQSIKNTVAAL